MSIPRLGNPHLIGNNSNNNNNNNRRPPMNRLPLANTETVIPRSPHDELVKYVNDSWNKISQDNSSNVVFYHEEGNRNLRNFKPFNLEAFWARRLVQNVHNKSQHS